MGPMTEDQRKWAESQIDTAISYGESSGGGRGQVVDYKPDSAGMGVFFIVKPRRQRRVVEDVDYVETYKEFPPRLLKPSQRGVRPRGTQRTNGAPLRIVSRQSSHSLASSSRWHGGR